MNHRLPPVRRTPPQVAVSWRVVRSSREWWSALLATLALTACGAQPPRAELEPSKTNTEDASSPRPDTAHPPPADATTAAIELHSRDCPRVSPERPNYHEHVAPILHQHCSLCHRPDQAAPFSLLSFEDAYEHAEQIAEVTRSRYMPPWQPAHRGEAGFVEFANERSSSALEIEILQRWAQSGSEAGPVTQKRAAPTFPEGWQLGQPDLVLEHAEVYTLAASGLDVYRNFVLDTGASSARWVRAWEFRPRNARVIHHAIVNLDRHDWARGMEAADPLPGFDGMQDQASQSPGDSYLVWAPGNGAMKNPEGIAWQLPAHADLVLQLHLQPTGKPEAVRPRVGLYFAEQAPSLRAHMLRVGDVPIDIPAGASEHWIRDQYTLPVAGRVFSIFPHAHYLAREIRAWAQTPEGARVWLLHIDDWDFNWQDEYRYASPPSLPAGAVIHMEISYDNSSANPRNPNTPPIRVRDGYRSVDEMGNLSIQFVPDDPKGLSQLRESKYRRQLARGGPTSRVLYNLGNIELERGQLAQAQAHYEQALKLDERNHHAHHNLSVVLRRLEQLDRALTHARRAAQLAPEQARALDQWANIEVARGAWPQAVQILERRLALRADAATHQRLATALVRVGEAPRAAQHLLEVARLRPDDFAAQVQAGEQLARNSDWPLALECFERALLSRPEDPQLMRMIDQLRRRVAEQR